MKLNKNRVIAVVLCKKRVNNKKNDEVVGM